MFNRGCRPNLLAIIAAQKAQSIQRSVTEARTIFVHSVPAVEKARSASTDVGGMTANESTRAVNAAIHTAVSDFLPYFNSFLFMRAVLCRAYFNVPTGTDVLGDLKSMLEGLVTRA